MNRKAQIIRYLLADWVSAILAWTGFFLYRKLYIEPAKFGMDVPLDLDSNYYLGVVVVPLFFLSLYFLTGAYARIYKRPRLLELVQTFTRTFIGVLILFFLLILDDEVASYRNYYSSFLAFLGLQFGFTGWFRFVLTSITEWRIAHRVIGFNTLIIGSNEQALNLYHELEKGKKGLGYFIKGYLTRSGEAKGPLKDFLPCLGKDTDLHQVVEKEGIEEILIAFKSTEHERLNKILNQLEGLEVTVKIIPDMYDIMAGQVRLTHVFGTPLIEINTDLMPTWQKVLKRLMDIVVSVLVLVILSPLYLVLAIGVKLSGPGPVFYSHERIGLNGKPFLIYKFRSMVNDAEKDGPKLARENDPRTTAFGKFMRKYRLDEFPQFYNVLIGDMSLVGPRPERKYFIEQITELAPHYRHLHKVRPGITCWGQVKFGYAGNVDQMVERLKYDIIYIENMSFALDLKILFYTVWTMVAGRGR